MLSAAYSSITTDREQAVGLVALGHRPCQRQPVEHRLLSLRIDSDQKLLDYGRDGRFHPAYCRLWGPAADLDGPAICRMFNHVIAKQTLSKYISSDHDPLFRFQRWRANLRILEVDEIKAVPCAPRSKSSTTTTAVIPDWPEPPRLIERPSRPAQCTT